PRLRLARPADHVSMTSPRRAEAIPAPRLGRPLGATRPRRTIRRRLLSHPLAVAGAALLLAVCLLVLAAAPLLMALIVHNETRDVFARAQPSSAAHWLGTDDLGRDLLMRLLEGGRVSLGIGLIIAAAAAVIGTLVGLTAGYAGGRTDALLMRTTDGIIALPR